MSEKAPTIHTPTPAELHEMTGIPAGSDSRFPDSATPALPPSEIEAGSERIVTDKRIEGLGQLAAAYAVGLTIEGGRNPKDISGLSRALGDVYIPGASGKGGWMPIAKYEKRFDFVQNTRAEVKTPDAAELLRLSDSDLAKLTGMSYGDIFKQGKLAAVDAYLESIGHKPDRPEELRSGGSELKSAVNNLAEGLANGATKEQITALREGVLKIEEIEKISKKGKKYIDRTLSGPLVDMYRSGAVSKEEYLEIRKTLESADRTSTGPESRALAEDIYNKVENLLKYRVGEEPEEETETIAVSATPVRTAPAARTSVAPLAPPAKRRSKVRGAGSAVKAATKKVSGKVGDVGRRVAIEGPEVIRDKRRKAARKVGNVVLTSAIELANLKAKLKKS